jgi:hypothetical protein
MRTATMLAILVALSGTSLARPIHPEPGVPLSASAPSINSIRPGILPPGSGDIEIAIYGSGIDERLGEVAVLWNGEPLEAVRVSESHPNSRVHATVPSALLQSPGSATVVLRQNTPALPLDSHPVTLVVGAPVDCSTATAKRRAICGAALGEVPTIEMVPKHVWYPFVAAPAGGVVRAVHRDSLANPEQHTVTSTTTLGRVPILGTGPDDAFDLALGRGEEGWIRIPEDRPPGSILGFFCTQHGNSMNPPFGAVFVR